MQTAYIEIVNNWCSWRSPIGIFHLHQIGDFTVDNILRWLRMCPQPPFSCIDPLQQPPFIGFRAVSGDKEVFWGERPYTPKEK